MIASRGLVRAWSDERTLHHSAHEIVVDKPAGVPCGAGPHDASTPRGDLRERLCRHGLGSLECRFNPPDRASGIALLAPRGGPLPARAALGRLGYVVAADAWRLPREGRLPRSAAPSEAIAYRVARLNGTRALIELECDASPDELLSAFASGGQPVVGDAHPDAPAATRLMLHVRSLSSLPQLSAPIPLEFETWLSGVPARSAAQFAQALVDAALARYELWPGYEAFFLLSEGAGEIAGLSIERYGEYAVVSISSEEAWELRDRVAECLMDHGASGVYVKRRVRADLRAADIEALAPSAPICGVAAPQVLPIKEGPFSFGVELASGLSTGLFLDQRRSWGLLRSSARGARVLNLFCYTGAFTIAAASGAAATTTSVDLSSRALTRLRHNLELNGLSGKQHRLLASDVPRWLARASRAGQRFDRIILDPPSFGTRGRGVLSTQRDYAGLVRSAAQLLEEGGSMLCVSHHRKISQQDLAELCARELPGGEAVIEPLVGDWDCPTLPGVSAVQSVLVSRPASSNPWPTRAGSPAAARVGQATGHSGRDTS